MDGQIRDLALHFTIGRIENYRNKNSLVQKSVNLHNQYSLFTIAEGCGLINIDFQDLKIKPGSVYFVSPGQTHSFNTQSLQGYYISFDLEFYHSVKSIFKLYDFPFFHTSLTQPYLDTEKHFSEIYAKIEDLFKEYSSPEVFGKWSILRSGLENLLIQLTRIKQKNSSDSKDVLITNNQKLRKLELLIDQNYKEHKEVSFYAEMLNTSSRHLNNIISQKTGKSISLMIQERILIEAKRLLLHSEKTIKEIAYELGFNDKAYFHRFFKKYANQTPGEFKKKA